MKLSTIRKIRELTGDDWRGIVEGMTEGLLDFVEGQWRCVSEHEVAEALKEYLESDDYCLGCFNDWFITEATNIPAEVIEALQKAEAFEALGVLIRTTQDMHKFAEYAAGYDGYGHFLALYDGEEHEIRSNDECWLLFKVG